MLQKKFISFAEGNDETKSYDLDCLEHNLPKKYYSGSLNRFFCEHDSPNAHDTFHFRLILDKYREDIKNIKNLSINRKEINYSLAETYNNTTNYLGKISQIHEDFSKLIGLFNHGTITKIYSLIVQDHELFKLKDLIESIKFLSDGRADYIGIGADTTREKNYLLLSKILIDRHLLASSSDKGANNLTFQLLKFMESLQNQMILFIDEAYAFIKYIFDNLLGEVAKLEGNTIDINFINNFALYYIHRHEYNTLLEKYNAQSVQFNKLKIKISELESEDRSSKAGYEGVNSEKIILLQKIKDEKNVSDSLKLKNAELAAELEKLKELNARVGLEYDNANKKLSEYSLNFKNTNTTIESLKQQCEESFKRYKLLEDEYSRHRIDSSNLVVLIKNSEGQISQYKLEIQAKQKQIDELNSLSSSSLTMASNELNEMKEIKNKYETFMVNLKKQLEDENKKYSELKINSEAKITEINTVNSEQLKEMTLLKAKVNEWQSKFEDANKLNEKLTAGYGETFKNLNSKNTALEQSIRELTQKNELNINLINQLQIQLDEYKLNYCLKEDISKYEEKINELNSLVFDLKAYNCSLEKRMEEIEFCYSESEKKLKLTVNERDSVNILYRDLLAIYNSIKDDVGKKRTEEDRRIIDISIRLNEVNKLYEADQKKIREFDSLLKTEREKFHQKIFILEKQVKDLNLIIEEYYKTKDCNDAELTVEKNKSNALLNENQALIEKIKSLTISIESLKMSNTQIINLNSQIDELRLQLHSQIKQNEILTLRLEQVERELNNERSKSNNTPRNATISELKNQLDIVFIQKEKLEKDLIEKKTRISQLQIANETLNARQGVLGSEINSFKDQNKSLNNFQLQIKNYVAQLEEAQKIKLHLEMENTDLQNKLNKSLIELEQVKMNNEQCNLLLSKFKEETNEMKKYDKRHEILANSKLEIEELKIKLEKSEKQKIVSSARRSLTSGNVTSTIATASLKAVNSPQEYLTLKERNFLQNSTKGQNSSKEFVFGSVKQKDSLNNNNSLNGSLSSYSNIDFVKNNPQNLLLNAKHWNLLNEWFNMQKVGIQGKISLNLLMKASRDGFGCDVFKKNCNGKSSTLTVVLTSFDKLIGGFTPLPWIQCDDDYKYYKDDSNKSFLFSLTNGKKYNLINPLFTICISSEVGPIFGGGSDLEVVDNCNINYNKYSKIGHSYDYKDAPESFYGGKKYLVKDYEVYELKY